MQTKKLLPTLALSLMAFSLSSLNGAPEIRTRTVACLPEGASGGISGGPLAIGQDLIGQVQDQALRESARDWYSFLTQVELSSLSQRQAMRSSYGIKTPLFASAADYSVLNLAPVSFPSFYGASGGLFAAPAFTGFAPNAFTTQSASVMARAPTVLLTQSGSSYFQPRF